jgi:hypothetical protein
MLRIHTSFCHLRYIAGRILSVTALTVGIHSSVMATDTDNLDCHLQYLIAHAKANNQKNGKIQALAANKSRARFDAQDRVLVRISLDGKRDLKTITDLVETCRGRSQGSTSSWGHGVVSAFLPIDQLESIAKMPGVGFIVMEYPPARHRVDKTSAPASHPPIAHNQGEITTMRPQSAQVLRTDIVNKKYGLTGKGVTVGVLSDSFNTARLDSSVNPPLPDAQWDIEHGYLSPVNVLADYIGDGTGGEDEGRAMCQIIYAEAPQCKLAFATASVSLVDFGNQILNLRTEANADVIVDDIVYLEEPIFSDGWIAQCIHTVSNNTQLPGRPVLYITAAGNHGNSGYRDRFRTLNDKEVRCGKHGNLKLNVTDPASPHYLDPKLTAGGWHNFEPNGGKECSTTIQATGDRYTLGLQWDDAFDQEHGITGNYNLLVFDKDGNYLKELSGTTNAFKAKRALQLTSLGELSLNTPYQIAITKTTQTDPLAPEPPTSRHIALYTDLGYGEIYSANLQGKYFNPYALDQPNIIGHAGAGDAITVGAYCFNWTSKLPYKPIIDIYTCPGPVTQYIDKNQEHIPSDGAPILFLKPEVSGVDRLATTFFGGLYYDGNPNSFYGTGAAASSIAGIAALMIEAAGGPGKLDHTRAREALTKSTTARINPPLYAESKGSNKSHSVTVVGQGDAFSGSNYFNIRYLGSGSLNSITIAAGATNLVWDTDSEILPFDVGKTVGITRNDVKVVVNQPSNSNSFKIQFTPGKFTAGRSAGFTLMQTPSSLSDALTAGAHFTATAADSNGKSTSTITGKFEALSVNTNYYPADGTGVADAVRAVNAVRHKASKR